MLAAEHATQAAAQDGRHGVVRRIHLVGCSPRSGTTLLHELMITCFDLAAGAPHEMSLYDRPPGMVRDYCTKAPSDMVHLTRLLPWDRNLYGIYVGRDPRDVIVSRHGRYPDRFWVDYEGWQRNERLRARFGDHPRLLSITYEALVSDPDAMQARIAARFGFLKQLHPFSAYAEVAAPSEASLAALRGVRKISTASIGAWRREKPRVKAQLEIHPEMPLDLIRHGYERDEAWVAELEGVEPDRTRSVREEHREARAPSRLGYPFMRLARRLGTLRRQMRYILTR